MINRTLIFVILFSLMTFGYVLYFGKGPAKTLGKAAPLFEAESLDAPKFVLEDHIGKKVILLNIWGTYCPPCRDEIPLLNTLAAKVGSNRFEIISLMEDDVDNIEKRTELLNKFRAKIPINFPVYYDQGGRIADAYGTFQIPESYLIDLKGNIVFKQPGPFGPWEIKDLVTNIRSLL